MQVSTSVPRTSINAGQSLNFSGTWFISSLILTLNFFSPSLLISKPSWWAQDRELSRIITGLSGYRFGSNAIATLLKNEENFGYNWEGLGMVSVGSESNSSSKILPIIFRVQDGASTLCFSLTLLIWLWKYWMHRCKAFAEWTEGFLQIVECQSSSLPGQHRCGTQDPAVACRVHIQAELHWPNWRSAYSSRCDVLLMVVTCNQKSQKIAL